jgi:hypothetical protein
MLEALISCELTHYDSWYRGWNGIVSSQITPLKLLRGPGNMKQRQKSRGWTLLQPVKLGGCVLQLIDGRQRHFGSQVPSRVVVSDAIGVITAEAVLMPTECVKKMW